MAQMNDIYNDFSSDLLVSLSGDVQTIAGLSLSQQRVMRRLMTNPRAVQPDGSILPADYVWHPDYGAGVARYIGQPTRLPELEARIRSQMFLESSVARNPAPVIRVQQIANGIALNIRYLEVETGTQAQLQFDVTQ